MRMPPREPMGVDVVDVVDVVPFHFSDDVQVSAGVKEIRCSSISWRGITRLAVRDLLQDRIDVVTASPLGCEHRATYGT